MTKFVSVEFGSLLFTMSIIVIAIIYQQMSALPFWCENCTGRMLDQVFASKGSFELPTFEDDSGLSNQEPQENIANNNDNSPAVPANNGMDASGLALMLNNAIESLENGNPTDALEYLKIAKQILDMNNSTSQSLKLLITDAIESLENGNPTDALEYLKIAKQQIPSSNSAATSNPNFMANQTTGAANQTGA